MSSKNVKDLHIHGKVAVVVGNEGNGISDEMLALCDEVVSIPMANKVESLNVGIAGSIVMCQIFDNKL